jgi:dienelactone hydrolase
VIEFNDSDPSMIFKMPRLKSAQIIKVQNCRKGTEEVINVIRIVFRNGEVTVHQIGICGQSINN